MTNRRPQKSRLNRLHIKIVQGRASFIEPFRVRVDDDEYSGDHIIIATGTRPRILPDMPVNSDRVLTSDNARFAQDFLASAPPKSDVRTTL